MAWEATPMPQPMIGHTGQKYHPPPPRPTASQMPSINTDLGPDPGIS